MYICTLQDKREKNKKKKTQNVFVNILLLTVRRVFTTVR